MFGQVLCTVALDSLAAAQRLDAMSALTGGLREKNFMLHYEFPSYATGEVGRGGGSMGRRELGKHSKKIPDYLGIFSNKKGGSSQNNCYPKHSPKKNLKSP